MREFVSPPVHLPDGPSNLGVETRPLNETREVADVQIQWVCRAPLALQVLRKQVSMLQQQVPLPAGNRRQQYRRLRTPEASAQISRRIFQGCEGSVRHTMA